MRTTVGKQRGASHWANATPGKTLATHVALGSDDTEANVSDLSLGTEFYRVAIDRSSQDDVTYRTEVVIIGSDIGDDGYAGRYWTRTIF